MPTVTILGDVDVVATMEIMSGVRRFAESRTAWKLIPLHHSQETLLGRLIADGGVDGAIGAFLSDRWLAGLAGHGVPLVNASNLSHIASVPSVVPADDAIGRQAAEHLLSRGCPSLAFAGIGGCAYSRLRQAGFAARAAASGIPVSVLPEGTLTGPQNAWQLWLRDTATERPIGVCCADDQVARRLILLCGAMNLAVPDDIAVVGVGDSAIDSFLARVGITSIPLPHEAIGYRAAELLDRMMQGKPPGIARVCIPPLATVIRESSRCGAADDPLVRRALDYIDAHLDSPLRVRDLAIRLRASTRLLELRFHETLHGSPRAVIRARRIAHAERLLHRHDLRIADIATACGYTDLAHFYHAFRRQTGRTPAACRRAQDQLGLT